MSGPVKITRLALLTAAAAMLLAVTAPAADPIVSNVRATQLADKTVEVLYDLSGAPAGGATVSVAFSQDSGIDISPALANTDLLNETFSGAGIPSGWVSSNISAWRVTNGELNQIDYAPGTNYVIFYSPGQGWTDYSFEVDARATGWYHCCSAFLIYFRYKDTANHYSVQLHSDGNLYLERHINNQGVVLGTAAIGSVAIRNPARFRIEVQGSQIKVYRAGVLVTTASDSTHSSGTVGFRSVHIPGFFDNVVVRSMCSPPSGAPTLTATAASSTSINLSWTTVSGATSYKLYRGSTLIYSGANPSYVDTGRSPNTQYCYTVRASSSCGDGPVSSERCATTLGVNIPQKVLFDDFRYDCIDGCARALGGSTIWNVVGRQDLTVSPADGGVLTFTLPAGRVGANSGNGSSPQIFTRGFYNAGLYAARLWFDDAPAAVADPVVQTFWTQSPHYWNTDKRYAECDFEYLANDWWDKSGKPTMFMTTWEWAPPRPPGDPQRADDSQHQTYRQRSLGGRWVHVVMKVRPGVSVEYSMFEADGTPILAAPVILGGRNGEFAPEPDSAMYILAEVWARRGDRNANEPDVILRTTTRMRLDWILHVQDAAALGYSWNDIAQIVQALQSASPVNTAVPVSEPPGGQCDLDGPGSASRDLPSAAREGEGAILLWLRRLVGGSATAAETQNACTVQAVVYDLTGVVLATVQIPESETVSLVLSATHEPASVTFTATGCSGRTTIDYWVTAATKPPDGGGGTVVVGGVVGAGRKTNVIPAAAKTPGAAGTTWVSDVVVHNPIPAPVGTHLFFLKRELDNSWAKGQFLTIPAGSSVKLADVVLATFGENATSSAILVASDNDLIVTSRTFNNAASGTYGQYIEGYPLSQAIAQNQQARLIQLTKNADYRTNIGVANASAETITVNVDIYRANGSKLGTRTYTVQPYGYYQETNPINLLTSADVDDAYAIIYSSTPGAKYFTYASVIDNRTGDPINVVPPAVVTGGELYLPAGANVSGVGGTLWRSDLEVHNPGSTQASYTIALLRRDQANASPTTRTYTLGAGQSVRYANVLQNMFNFTGAATLRVTPTAGSIAATMRTFNDQPGGTYGQFIPGAPAEAAIAAGQEGRLVQLSQSSAETTGFRTNVGFVNAGGGSVTVEAKLYRGDGTLLGTRTYTLQGYEFKQVDRIFREVTSADVPDGFAVLRTTTSGGRFFAYASVIDNRSGDPIYVPAKVLGTAACSYAISPTSRSHGAGAETGTVTVTAGSGCAWTATSGAGWITITSGASGSGNGTVGYSVAANSTTSERSGTVTIAGQTFTVTQAASSASNEITITLPGNVPLVLVKIPKGTFTMGSPDSERGRDSDEGPQHQVTLTQDYYMGKTEVTQRQWVAVMGSNPSYFTSCGLDCPVERVSWNDICGGTTGSSCTSTSFIGKVNTLLGTSKFRLPTEAEWERAARGGTTGPFSFDTSANPSWDLLCGSFPQAEPYMWWCGNNSPDGTKAVGTKQANPYGLRDMHGNVWEWVGDWYGSYPSSAVTDPTGPTSGSYRVARGGGWSDGARYCRSAFRGYNRPDLRNNDGLGFRLARSL